MAPSEHPRVEDSEYPFVSDAAWQIAEELRLHFSIKGNPYNNILLTTNHPGTVDVYDPNILVERELLTLYWPNGSPDHARSFETVSLLSGADNPSNASLAEGAMFVRTALLSASIGKAALDRVPEDMKQSWEHFKSIDAAPILYAMDHCALFGLPLALCQTGRVVKSEIAPVGARMMHLWYPNYLSPKPVLTRLKKVVKGIIEQETI